MKGYLLFVVGYLLFVLRQTTLRWAEGLSHASLGMGLSPLIVIYHGGLPIWVRSRSAAALAVILSVSANPTA